LGTFAAATAGLSSFRDRQERRISSTKIKQIPRRNVMDCGGLHVVRSSGAALNAAAVNIAREGCLLYSRRVIRRVDMASHGDAGEQTGTMDISEHQRTWKLFISGIKYSLSGIGLIMLFLLIFRTHG
jgi:Bacterial aa3 type cytochrome c oxidase subunit IV